MTDYEIIKAVECCIRNDLKECKICPYDKLGQGCRRVLQNDILDLIYRQKAEIERLEKSNKILSQNADTAFQDGLNEAQDLYAEQIRAEMKSEAIKEFAERLKENVFYANYCGIGEFAGKVVSIIDIDYLAEEMTEVENA